MRIRIIIGILLISCLSGCAFGGKNWLVGYGKREVEYYPDGKPKREVMESKTPIQEAISVSGVKGGL